MEGGEVMFGDGVGFLELLDDCEALFVVRVGLGHFGFKELNLSEGSVQGVKEGCPVGPHDPCFGTDAGEDGSCFVDVGGDFFSHGWGRGVAPVL